jgi:hypothetical protein
MSRRGSAALVSSRWVSCRRCRRASSTARFNSENSAGAYCASSIVNGGGCVLKNNAGSRWATSRATTSSSETTRRVGARCSSSEDFPHCRMPHRTRTGKDAFVPHAR